ncbi:hypothetical protein N7486_001161 [Penicillium sp. IBT 16267x]|nr:hypothetical protein N7486_001161 [Penicillium sp. IBT 16267x]
MCDGTLRFFDEDLSRIFHPQYNHGQAISDQHYVHSSSVCNTRSWDVMGSEDADRLSFPIEKGKTLDCRLLSRFRSGFAYGRMRTMSD